MIQPIPLQQHVCSVCSATVYGGPVPVDCPECSRGARDRRGRRNSRVESPRELKRLRVRLTVVDSGESERPRTRGECREGIRPCPYVSCRHHLAIDVTRAGSLRLNYPGVEVEEMEHSCSLDLAEQHERSHSDIAVILSMSRERVRQIEVDALRKISHLLQPED